MKNLKKTIGKNIKMLHSGENIVFNRQNGTVEKLSLRKLAVLIGVSPSCLSQVENGKVYMSVPVLVKTAEVLSKLNGFTITISDLTKE